MKKSKLLIWILFVIGGGYFLLRVNHNECLFIRNGQCFKCDDKKTIVVPYKENCEVCPKRKATYISEGFVPAWQCSLDKDKPKKTIAERSTKKCPFHKPLKDVLGNCFSCDENVPIRVGCRNRAQKKCGDKRYYLPDDFADKSMKCPKFEQIKDPEVCFQCGGFWEKEICVKEGKNYFCQENKDCKRAEWCYPLKIVTQSQQGICVDKLEGKWIFSQTDGYTLNQAELFCERQGMRLATLEEMEKNKEILLKKAPEVDAWFFFESDGVLWLDSLVQEFIFTKEGESENLGGHKFYVLCHKE